jgi:hypothetical protein
MAEPRSLSVREVSAAAKSTVAKVLEQHHASFQRPNYHFGFFPPPWWFGIIVINPDLGKVTFKEAEKLAVDLSHGIAGAIPATKGGKPGVILNDGHLTIGFAPPKEINFIGE